MINIIPMITIHNTRSCIICNIRNYTHILHTDTQIIMYKIFVHSEKDVIVTITKVITIQIYI